MRDVVTNYLRSQLPNVRIVHEMVMGRINRADLAAVGRDRIVAVGLKSARDVLKRAEKQMETFGRLAQRSGKLDSGEQYSRAKDDETGITMGINGVSNTVTTVFTEGEEVVFKL